MVKIKENLYKLEQKNLYLVYKISFGIPSFCKVQGFAELFNFIIFLVVIYLNHLSIAKGKF